MKNQNVMEEEWDTLIVLDACRYDYFSKYYDKFLSGKLEKKESRGSTTQEWLPKTFTDYYDDITYVSANPYINSQDVPLKIISPKELPKKMGEWKATEHFSKIIDVWNFGWDDEISTIHPKKVNDATLSVMDNNRKILHYIQPHAPFLHPEYRGYTSLGITNKLEDEQKNEKDNSLRDFIGNTLESILGLERTWKLRDYLGLEPVGIWEKAYVNNQAGEVYTYNLKIVLEEISKLINQIEGKIIITADHGECLGDNGIWGHRIFDHCDTLTEVPWLEAENV